MTRTARSLAVVAVLSISVVAARALAGGPRIAPTATNHYDMTDCDGGQTVNLPAGEYLLSFKDEGVYLCSGDAGCAAGGHWYPANLTMRQSFGANEATTPISCRSDGVTGDVSISRIAPGT